MKGTTASDKKDSVFGLEACYEQTEKDFSVISVEALVVYGLIDDIVIKRYTTALTKFLASKPLVAFLTKKSD